MYRLLVHYPQEDVARATVDVTTAADVLTHIPEILAEHEGCAHIEVMFNDVRLFAVDCAGNRLP